MLRPTSWLLWMFVTGFPFRKAGEPRPVTAKEVSEDRWHLSDVVLPLPLPGKPVPESGGRLLMEASKCMEHGWTWHPGASPKSAIFRYDEFKERRKALDVSLTGVLWAVAQTRVAKDSCVQLLGGGREPSDFSWVKSPSVLRLCASVMRIDR